MMSVVRNELDFGRPGETGDLGRRHRSIGRVVAFVFLCVMGSLTIRAAELSIDFTRTNGVIRPLHGGNNGPLGPGEIVDLTPSFRALSIPFVRVHDSGWPYPDIVDIHAVFPNFEANPEDPSAYRFGPTDDYLRAITNAGARIVYRLGESIEHARRKRYVHPPVDSQKWAQICVGVIRHYNEGWADGLKLGIEYWEIWNEPENRPAMWTGPPAQFYELYSTTARTIKTRWPSLKVGGPALGHQGDFKNGRLLPSEFLRGFLDRVRQDNAPLDFFSWHCYSADAAGLVGRAGAVRDFLDASGFRKTESHLNEWNYLPDQDWGPVLGAQGASREAWYARLGGAEGAAFAAAVLIGLQDQPIDVANFYATDNQPFGLFTQHGAPKKSFHAFAAFREMLNVPRRVDGGSSPKDGCWWLTGLNHSRTRAAVLISWPDRPGGKVGSIDWSVTARGLPWSGASEYSVRFVDGQHDFEPASWAAAEVKAPKVDDRVSVVFKMTGPSVALISWRPAQR